MLTTVLPVMLEDTEKLGKAQRDLLALPLAKANSTSLCTPLRSENLI